MTTIQHILSIAHSGLQASQAQVALASQNLANVDTPGYARQVLPLSAAFGGLGVLSGSPYAIRSVLLERSLAATTSRLGFHDQETQLLGQIEAAVNDLDGTGLGTTLRDFEAALTNLSANPGGDIERGAVLRQAEVLSGAFASTRDQFSSAREAAMAQGSAVAAQVNALAGRIAELNGRIRGTTGEQANALVSQRTDLIQQLSGYVGVEAIHRSDGTVQLNTAGGRPLVESTYATELRLQPGPPPTVAFEKANGEILKAMGPVGGQMGAVLETVTETLDPGIAKLDAMAYHFMDAFNAVHVAGYGLNGGTGYDFFELPPGVEGAAGAIRLSADVDGFPENIAAAGSAATTPGGNENIVALARLIEQEGVLPSGESVDGAFRNLTNDVTQNILRAEQSADLERASREQIQNLLASEEGVNIDEELIRVTQANAALSAASTLLTQTQQMTTTILNLVG